MYYKLLLTTFTSIIITYTVFAQCPSGNVELDSQQAVDDFAAMYPNCTEIDGALKIGKQDDSNDITDLSPLSQIANITLGLAIYSTTLMDLDALKNLTFRNLTIIGNNSLENLPDWQQVSSVNGLDIWDNEQLISLEGLNGLTNLGFVNIKNNSQLISLEALSNATSAIGIDIIKNERLLSLKGLHNIKSLDLFFFVGLNIKENHALTSLEGLEGLEDAALGIDISNNDNLLTLKGLESLNLVVSATITDNKSLVSLEGLSDIDQVQELIVKNNPVLEGLADIGNPNQLYYVEISNNASLESLSGLDSIMSLGYLIIENNDALTDLSGLGNLTEVRDRFKLIDNDILNDITTIQNIPLLDTLLDFSINDCVNLSVCNLPNICEALDNNIPLDITGNATGCNDTNEVEVSCTMTSTIAPYILPDFTIMPNPNTGIFNLRDIKKGVYQVQDVAGRIIQNGDVKNNSLINISKEVEGVYFISIQIENGVVTKRIIKL